MRLRLGWQWQRRRLRSTLRRGFTLLEVLIVVVLLSVALFMALPAIERQLRWTDRIRMETALIDAIQQARLDALENGMVTRVRHDHVLGELRIERMEMGKEPTCRKVVPLAPNARIQLTDMESGMVVSSIDLLPDGLFRRRMQIDGRTHQHDYSWITDRATGTIRPLSQSSYEPLQPGFQNGPR